MRNLIVNFIKDTGMKRDECEKLETALLDEKKEFQVRNRFKTSKCGVPVEIIYIQKSCVK